MKKRFRDHILDRDGRACVKCGSEDDLTIDHVVPKAALRVLMGEDYAAFCSDVGARNYQVMCRPCNEVKDATAADYRRDPALRAGLIETLARYGVVVRFCVEELVV